MTDHYDYDPMLDDDPYEEYDDPESGSICEINTIQSALSLIEELNQALSGRNPHIVLKFQQLADLLEAAGWMLGDAIQQRDALLYENERISNDLSDISGDYQQLVDALMHWPDTDNTTVRILVDTVLDAHRDDLELDALREDRDLRTQWIDSANKVFNDHDLAVSLADYLFEQAPRDPQVIRAIFEALTVSAG